MRRDVKKAVSWIEQFEKKANAEATRMDRVNDTIEGEISDLRTKIADLEGNKGTLLNAKKKVLNLLKALNGE